jgi:nicotinamidase-related amidase
MTSRFVVESHDDAEAAMRAILEYNGSLYASKGCFQRRRLGFGTTPAVLVIDMANGWTRPGTPYECDGMDTLVPATCSLLEVARGSGVPIIFTAMAYDQPTGLNSDAGLTQFKFESTWFQTGGEAAQIDERLGLRADERYLVKKHASAFNGTDLSGHLRAAGVDTILVTGVTASACVRNTCEDAIAEGFRAMVVRELIGDRVPGAVAYHLFDIDAKFGDVVTLADTIHYLKAQPAYMQYTAAMSQAGTKSRSNEGLRSLGASSGRA